MKHTTRAAGLAALAILGLSACDNRSETANPSSPNPGDPPVLRFSAIPDQDKTELKEKFDAWAKHLTEALDVPVEYVPASDYKASVEMFRNGDIQLAWFGGLTGVQARHSVPGARAIAQGKADPQYISYFIVHKDTGLTASDEFPAALAGRSFTFGDESSTSGRLMPEFFIRKNTGKSPEEFFGKMPGFSGSHVTTVELVESGQVDAGAVNYKVYDKRVAEGKTDPDICRVIWKTPFYADYNFTAHPALEKSYGEGFIDKLQQTLIAIDDPKLLSALPREALIKAESKEFDGIKKVAIDLGFLR